MPVFDDGLWWDVNWPWMVLWLLTASSAVALVVLIAGPRLRRGASPSAGLLAGRTCLYLDSGQIMDNYQMNDYTAALRREVEQRTSSGGAVRLAWRLLPALSPDASYETSRQVVTSYIEEATPISVIGVILDALERSGAVVRADLRSATIERGPSLRTSSAVPGARLSAATDGFVLLTADLTGDGTTGTVLTSLYGGSARVRLTCDPDGFRAAVPGPAARLRAALCLVKAGTWHPESDTLDVRALAIFT
ncbi:hypothetical protein OG900_19360 [Streptomyces sp. NBC_00433]